MIADNLDQAYVNFDPSRPLPGVSEFYVKRKNNPLDRIRRSLLRDNPLSPKLLFSGHRGSGKSTELNRLTAYPEIRERYFIVNYSIRDVLDPVGLDYTDLVFSIGAQILIKAIDANLNLRSRLLEELSKWIESIMDDVFVDSIEAETTELRLETLFIRALSRLKIEYVSRERMRQAIGAQLSRLVSIINLMVAEVELRTGKKVFVSIDDLDKPDLEVARRLFYERQTSLTLPGCIIIYTIPIAILYSSEAGQVMNAFSQSYILPNVTIANHADRSPDVEGRAVMREFVEKRMSLELIGEDALNYAIYVSGGLFREMARIMAMSADNAIARDAERIEKQDVEDAESEIRNEFRRMLETKDYEALEEIYRKRELIGSDRSAKLLHNLSILEYQNEDNWCDVHPAIIPLIEGER